ncbi:type IV secretion system protein [Ralstonia nicotianae]|uniref:type IV secretion system protein n=1 Tax=Ralstonia pseudosolanacearum TaxID=1310165 RepID=UPI002003365E|nr:type IV secretion system protein [Ralstonia pseudosolanacearum]MCK4118411.1 type IV secretion system protein [Ralstonia pseudosolanacearum]
MTARRVLHALVACSVLLAAAHGASALAQADASPDLGATAGQSQTGPSLSGPAGAVGEAIAKSVTQFNTVTSNMMTGAVSLSRSLTPEAGRFALALGLITIVLAGLRFAGSNHPTSAWIAILEEFATLGIFSALFLGYERFAPGIYQYFYKIATTIAGSELSPAATLATTAGSLWDSYGKALDAANWYQKIGVALALIPLVAAFAITALTSVVYTFFVALGEIQVSVGIVVGQLAVALGFSDYTRRYFLAWLDFMVGGSLYAVVAAIIARLVTASFASALRDVNTIGTDTMAGACFALVLSLFLLFVSFEIPKVAGSLFGNGAGITGGAVSGGIKAAWSLGKRLSG